MNEETVTLKPGEAEAGRAIGELRDLVRRGNRRWRRLVLLEALGLAVAAPLAYLWFVLLADSLLHLPTAGRLLAGLLFLSAVGWQAVRLRAAWRRAHFTDDEVALAMERGTAGGIQNRLINAIQLARRADGNDAGLSRAAVLENVERLRRIRLEQAARARPALVRIGLAAVFILAGLVFRLVQPERFGNAATRIFMPFAKVAPLYRTVLEVEPGDVEALPGSDVTIQVTIRGRVPASLAVIRNAGGDRSTAETPVPRGTNAVDVVFRSVTRTLTYAVRGGDFVTGYYTIRVPVPAELRMLRAEYRFPAYTRLPPQTVEGTGGDLEAVAGTDVALAFTLSSEAESASLRLERPSSGPGGAAGERPLARSGGAWTASLELRDLAGYRLVTRETGRAPLEGRRYGIKVLEDRAPELQLAGLEAGSEAAPDAVLPLTLVARDDFGLAEAAIAYRVKQADPRQPERPWETVRQWAPEGGAAAFATSAVLPVALMNAAEGERVELAARGRDADPGKGDGWTTGDIIPFLVGGSGTALQVLYESILNSEQGLVALAAAQEARIAASTAWHRRLEPGSGERWDDQASLKALSDGMKAEAAGQAALREQAAALARAMPEEAGALRVSAAMLADTEMVRCIRIFESVDSRPRPQEKRAAIADARLTQERMLRSLREITGQFEAFRKDWELNHMIPFTRMLAERQARMAAESGVYGGLGAEAADPRLRSGTARRQERLAVLAGLAGRAFAGLGTLEEEVGPFLASAFAGAARAFETNGVRPAMAASASYLKEGQWGPAAERQAAAAGCLEAICAELIRLQAEAARLALESLREQAGKSPESQKAVEALRAGSGEKLVELDPNQVVLGEILKMQKLADELKKRFTLNQDDKQMGDYTWTEAMMGMLKGKPADNPDFSIMTLAKQPGGQKSFPQSSDLAGNKNLAQLVSDTYEDLAGDLLEEADDLRDQYETYNLNAGGQGIEQGDVGKQAGDLNSVSGAAATGNMKPPTHDFGGASRIGRQGARSHGMALGSESIDRRGRDQAQEGQDEAPDQAGVLRETASDDPQKDSSTGVGGKEVQSAETPSFSPKDSGEWKDEYADRLKAPRNEVKLVEHQGKPLNPRIGELLRDLESTQEQVIERIKTLKKDLDKLYLPTEQFDEILDRLTSNLDRLREAPDDPEAFKSQLETLEKLKGAVVVFNRPASDFQPSLLREQALKNGILDEPAWPAPPGYEEAVKRYYESLSP